MTTSDNSKTYMVTVLIPVDNGRNHMPARREVRAESPAEARAIAENLYGKCLGVGGTVENHTGKFP